MHRYHTYTYTFCTNKMVKGVVKATMLHPVFATSAKLQALEYMVKNPHKWFYIRTADVDVLMNEINKDARNMYSQDALDMLQQYLESLHK